MKTPITLISLLGISLSAFASNEDFTPITDKRNLAVYTSTKSPAACVSNMVLGMLKVKGLTPSSVISNPINVIAGSFIDDNFDELLLYSKYENKALFQISYKLPNDSKTYIGALSVDFKSQITDRSNFFKRDFDYHSTSCSLSLKANYLRDYHALIQLPKGEELSIRSDFNKFKSKKTVSGIDGSKIEILKNDVFRRIVFIPSSKSSLKRTEVVNGRWLDINELEELIDDVEDKFNSHHNVILDAIKDGNSVASNLDSKNFLAFINKLDGELRKEMQKEFEIKSIASGYEHNEDVQKLYHWTLKKK